MKQMERKEPTLTSIVPDNDEIAAQQRRINKSDQQMNRPAAPAVRQAGSLTVAALVVAVAALGGSGFLAWQLQKTQQTLQSSELRIVVLEKKLELSDDESTQSVTAIRAKLKWADSEIRKLWGVSFDTNRKNISANVKKMASLEKSLTTAKKDSARAKKLAEGHSTRLKDLQQLSSTEQKRLNTTIGGVEDQRKQLQAAVDVANRVEQQLSALKADLSDRVGDNEEAIEAIDAYRRTINKDLLQIQQRLNQQSAKP